MFNQDGGLTSGMTACALGNASVCRQLPCWHFMTVMHQLYSMMPCTVGTVSMQPLFLFCMQPLLQQQQQQAEEGATLFHAAWHRVFQTKTVAATNNSKRKL